MTAAILNVILNGHISNSSMMPAGHHPDSDSMHLPLPKSAKACFGEFLARLTSPVPGLIWLQSFLKMDYILLDQQRTSVIWIRWETYDKFTNNGRVYFYFLVYPTKSWGDETSLDNTDGLFRCLCHYNHWLTISYTYLPINYKLL